MKPVCPAPNFELIRRECYRVTFDGPEGEQVFTRIPFSALSEGDMFTLEARPSSVDVDPISGTVAVERMYRAMSDPYMSDPLDGEWLIQAERL